MGIEYMKVRLEIKWYVTITYIYSRRGLQKIKYNIT